MVMRAYASTFNHVTRECAMTEHVTKDFEHHKTPTVARIFVFAKRYNTASYTYYNRQNPPSRARRYARLVSKEE